ncbi:efflux RND transporter periplasmic adaptor subunit [Paludibacterium purpuratum]|uniref:Cu(I)/Ag(I) efflux system membrane fusion protein n=1 Tax=Paludibacterium purpuratum TaxID=1144873 RepID=A0A4R7B4Q8_9NEIS|nr:efflux RND transporter periplasmic adaptor subunit [Paludibacterium purpuratum]TDR77833.1 Cu(I)/Ag(I) efflux system membrane fusion protein [Paludibacterium purpuratum]
MKMNKKQIAAAAAVLTVVAGISAWKLYPAYASPAPESGRKVLYWYDPMDPATHFDQGGTSPMGMKLLPKYDDASAPKANSARKVMYWTDPMQPGSRYDKPGKSPLMDMALVPVYAPDTSALPGAVTVPADTLKHSAIRYVEAKTGVLSDALTVVGTVKVDERRVSSAISRVGGWVSALPGHATFDSVSAGATVATVTSPDARQMAAEYDIAKSDPQLRAAVQQKLSTWGVSRSGGVAVTAPQSGFISEVLVHPGAKVDPGQPIMTIVNLDRVWVVGELLENDANRVKPGDAVSMTLPSLPGQTLQGKVESVLPQLSADSRTLPVRVSVANPRHLLRPGMLASLSLGANAVPHLLIPSEAVIRSGRRTLVVLAGDDGQFAPVPVVTGREAGGQVEILSGLKAGQRIVASGQFLLDSESNLQHGLETLQSSAPTGARP